MGIAALVLGIISIIIGFIPLCGAIAYLPALVGLVLGIVDLVKSKKENQSKGLAIAGTVLSVLALIVITMWLFVFTAVASSPETQKELNTLENKIENIETTNQQ
ncbi:MAG: DUF4190 domain-containing protein [Clostridia bacterium]